MVNGAVCARCHDPMRIGGSPDAIVCDRCRSEAINPDAPLCRLCQGSGVEADDVYGVSTCTECWGTGSAKVSPPLRPLADETTERK